MPCLALGERAGFLFSRNIYSVIQDSIHGAHSRLGSEEIIWFMQTLNNFLYFVNLFW